MITNKKLKRDRTFMALPLLVRNSDTLKDDRRKSSQGEVVCLIIKNVVLLA